MLVGVGVGVDSVVIDRVRVVGDGVVGVLLVLLMFRCPGGPKINFVSVVGV